MYRRHQADSCRYNLRRVNAIVVHNDLAESARIEHVVLVSIQGAATRLGIKSQAIGANTLSEHIAVGIGAFADSARLEAGAFTLQAAHAAFAHLLGVVGVLQLALLD